MVAAIKGYKKGYKETALSLTADAERAARDYSQTVLLMIKDVTDVRF